MAARDSAAPTEPPNKRLKKTKTSLPNCKAKSEIEILNDSSSSPPMDSGANCCGICLREDREAIRGFIDSCDHYFCFVCIMEWAKVESRCPFCKRRFSTVRRPPKDGLFPAERIVNVPVRDQVYHYLGNSTISCDPYNHIECTVCHCNTDESLLLLCDLCDSTAAHTYCLGLGNTVPEDDWFCEDCYLARANVTVYDIVREDDESSPTMSFPHGDQVSSLAHEVNEPGARTYHTVGGDRTSESVAKTLGRNVHARIRALRENWNSLQSGSLTFSPHSVDSGGKTSRKVNIGDVPSDKTGQQQFSSSTTCQKLVNQVGCSGGSLYSRSSQDIEKAWKMMNIAKSKKQSLQRTGMVHCPSNYASGLGSAPRQLSNIKSSFHVSRSKPVRNMEVENIAKHNTSLSLVKESEKHKFQMHRKQQQGRVIVKGGLKIKDCLPNTRSEIDLSLPSHGGNGGQQLLKNMPGASANVVDEPNRSACLISPVGSQLGASGLSQANSDLCASSYCKVDVPHGKGLVENSHGERKRRIDDDAFSHGEKKRRKDDDAKSEIQSLVKLNLKLLNMSKHLGTNDFKGVAWLATHAIMAACELEHPRPGVPIFPTSVCCHSEQVQQHRKSVLMPSSCRKCFYVFVKDVVNSIRFEKVGHG